jgi:predicted MFS family arabinose efflux permease
MTLLSIGTLALAFVGESIGGPQLIAVLAVSGIGIGLGSGSLQTSAIESIEPEHAGMASGASMTSRYLGSIVGASVLAGVVAGGGGLAPVLWMTALAACGAAVLAIWLPRRIARASTGERIAPIDG